MVPSIIHMPIYSCSEFTNQNHDYNISRPLKKFKISNWLLKSVQRYKTVFFYKHDHIIKSNIEILKTYEAIEITGENIFKKMEASK